MPMIRIETRSKTPPGAPDQPPPARRPGGDEGRRGAGPAILAGALVGLVAIGLISVFVVQRRQAPAPAPAATVATVAPVAAASAPPSAVLAGQPPLNADFPREAIIAYVNGEPYTMGQLEVAVRVAKALGTVSADPVPEFGSPEMRDFQIRMLRREIDSILLRQALARTGTPAPQVDVQPVIDGYLKQYNGSPEQLATAVAAAGIGPRELQAWFERGRDTQFFIQTQLMQGRAPEERDAAVTAWLAEQWDSQDIQINFYDPDATVPAPAATPSP